MLPTPTSTPIQVLQQLKLALDLESEEHARRFETLINTAPVRQRVAEGVCWYPVRIRETGFGFGEYPYVVVERPGDRKTHDMISGGKPAMLFSKADREQRTIHGTLHWVNRNTAHIILRGNDHPEWLDDGQIGLQLIYDASGFSDMEKAVASAIEAHDSRLATLRDTLLGARRAEWRQAPHDLVFDCHLNASQQLAVQRCMMANDVAIIHGPPGTGKTTTLVEVIKRLSSRSKPILVCAPSNSAVDLLTERCSDAGLDVVRIGNLSRVDESVMRHTLSERWKSHPLADEIKRYRKQSDEYRRLAMKYKRSFGRSEMEQRKLLLQEAKKVMADARRLEEEVTERVLSSADVVACTLVGSRNHEIRSLQFAAVVIDEAGQALDPAMWIPISRADMVVLAGDPHQLPPTIMSQQAVRAGLSTTLLERAIEAQPEAVTLLNEQYRMNRVIMGYSNQVFYKGEVIAHPSVEEHTHPADRPLAESLVMIDTAGRGWNEEAGDNTESLRNIGEAQVAMMILEELSPAPDITVGVISPYRGQVRELQDRLPVESASWFSDLDVNTVDSFQGSECDVIVISLVRSNDDSEIGFLQDIRRMNVAMTRARKKLIVIGDSATIGAHPFYRGFLEYVERHGTYRSAWEFAP